MIDFSNMSIPRFGFIVTLLVYLAILFAEYLRPGFVSNAMNAHVLWIVIIGFGIWETKTVSSLMNRDVKSHTAMLGSMIVGFVLALIVWHLGSLFGDTRLFFALAIGILPFVLLK